MTTERRTRLWIEAGLGIVSLSLFVLTLLMPAWIEVAFRVDPDQHSGSLEWAIDGMLLAVAVAAGALTRLERRRPRVGVRPQLSPSSRPS